MPEKAEDVTLPSVKDLASSEASLRRKCLNNIITYLNERGPSSPLTSTDCLQFWRGLYVALYMHDSKNALSVQKLVAELAGLNRIMDDKDQQLADASGRQDQSWLDTWTAAFWETVCREWASIDQWRMNKVLLLVRFFVRDIFSLALQWVITEDPKAKDRTARQVQILETWPLSARERKVPDGLRLHVLDVWVDELVGQLNTTQASIEQDTSEGDAESKKSMLLNTAKGFMEPVEKISKQALSKGVRTRAKEAITLVEEKLS